MTEHGPQTTTTPRWLRCHVRDRITRSDAADFGRLVTVNAPEGPREIDIYTPEGFKVLSQLWTRSGWQNK